VLYLYLEEESNSALDAAFVCWPYFRQVLRLQVFSLIRGGSQLHLPRPFHIRQSVRNRGSSKLSLVLLSGHSGTWKVAIKVQCWLSGS